jgi:hypothetical protein
MAQPLHDVPAVLGLPSAMSVWSAVAGHDALNLNTESRFRIANSARSLMHVAVHLGN